MPYSEKLNLVHVAIPKTGTTSVVRTIHYLHKEHGGELVLLKEWVNRAFRKRHQLDQLQGRPSRRAKHLSALHLRAILGERYEEAFSFSMVRNPWARTASRYRFTHVGNRPSWLDRLRRRTGRTFHQLDFDTWLRKKLERTHQRGGVNNQLDKLIDENGEIIVDFVGRLENVQADFAKVCESIGVPPIEVPYVNHTSRAHYSEAYSDWGRDLVAEIHAPDIEAFGYEFEDRR